MRMARELTERESLQLESWLNDNGLQLCEIHRELSDGVAMANLIHKFYPKLVDLTSYKRCSSIPSKLANWEQLNEKVLSKLGLFRTQRTLERIANSRPGYIELLLFDLMQAKEVTNAKREKEFKDFTDNSKIVMVVLHRKVNGVPVQQPEKMIMYSIYEWTLHELQSKQLELQEAKLRIAELESKLERLEQAQANGEEWPSRPRLSVAARESAILKHGAHLEIRRGRNLDL